MQHFTMSLISHNVCDHLPAGVDGDADGLGHLLADSGGLELLEGEPAAQALLHVVLERRAPHHRAQRLDRPRGDLR